MVELPPAEVRIPAVLFVSWERLEGSGFPEKPAPELVPDLAVEGISRSNTRREMESKLHEYFTAGVRLVWYVDPRDKTVMVYTAADQSTKLTEQDTLDGGEVLPGLSINLAEFFTMPEPPK